MSVGKVYALCLRLLVDTELAEKLTADAFLIVRRNIAFFREDILFSSWITGITIYTILDWLRNNGGLWNNPDEMKPGQVRRNLNGKIENAFEISIQSLPDKERFVFILHDIEKYSVDEIADLLAFTKENVKSILHKAYEQLVKRDIIADKKEYVRICLTTLPMIIQPEHDIWKNIFARLNSEHNPVTESQGEQLNVSENEEDKKKKKFGFLNWKKK